MHSTGGKDARSGLAQRLRDSSSALSPTDMWDRQSLLKDRLDCANRDKYGSAKRDWPIDARASSTRSSNSLFSNVGSSDSAAKRRDPGRHGPAFENSRYGGGACKPLDISSVIRSPPENSKVERDLFISTGGPSPGYSSSLSMEKSGKRADGISLRGSRLSLPNIRPGSSPCVDKSSGFDPPIRINGMQNACDFPSCWERDRSKYSSSSNMSSRDKEKFWGRREYHRRTHSLPKLDSSKDWRVGDTEPLEARVDRYGSALTREPVLPHVLSASNKEHHWYDWRTRERTVFGGFSSCTGGSFSSKTNLKEICAASTLMEQPWSSSPPYQLATQNSFSDQGNQDFNARVMSSKKRARLTWGQGLAKYEKEKIEEDHFVSNTCEEGHRGLTESQEDMHASSDCQSRLTENGSFSPLHDQHREQDSCDSGNLSGCESERASTPKNLAICHKFGPPKHLPLKHSEVQSKENFRGLGVSVSPREAPYFQAPALQASNLPEVQVLISNFWRERPTLSKDVLTLYVVKVEQEIDLLGKELVKLGYDGVDEIGSLCDASNLKVEGWGGESCDADASATDALLDRTEDSSAIVVACAKSVPLLHKDDGHVELPEVLDFAQTSSVATQSDMGGKIGLDAVHPPAIPAGGLQCESGLLRPDAEATSTDKVFGFVESILLSNTLIAERSLASLAHLNSPRLSAISPLGVLYGCPCLSWTLNAESHSRKRKRLQTNIVEEKMSVSFVERVSAVKLKVHRELLKQKQSGTPCELQRGKRSKVVKAQQREYFNAISHQSSVKSVLKSEEVRHAKTLNVGEDNRGFLQMPAMLLGREKELHNFKTKNGLVIDPISAEQERKFFNPWSKEEKRLFLEKYSLFGKDFRRLASYLEHKSVADCIEFYYRNQKNQEFERVRHEHRLRKHCRFQVEKYSRGQSAVYLATNPSIDSSCEESILCLEGLSLIAAAAAAMSAPTTKPAYRSLARQACIKVARTQFAVKCASYVESKSSHSRARLSNVVEWSVSETKSFLNAVVMFGKDFDNISRHKNSRSACSANYISGRLVGYCV
ncbi:hypothetical protein L7F22_033560 [Adiantum nelumboides]|nr:hypothetical protein [Adiantum nelumboides]